MRDDAAVSDELPIGEEGLGDWDVAARVAALLDVVQAYAVLDFSGHAAVGERGDDLDALAAGINMLGEELEAAHEDFEQRVRDRTAELTATTQRLESEMAERHRVEAELERANTALNGWVAHLEWLNAQIERVTEVSNLLQGAGDRDEALGLFGQVGPQIFAGTRGEVYLYVATGDVLELATSWPEPRDRPRDLAPNTCWALRRGRVHAVHGSQGLRCAHLSPGPVAQTLCVPLTAQGETRGLLHLRWDEEPETDGHREASVIEAAQAEGERLALIAGEQFALALANLELREALRDQAIRDGLTGLYNRRYLDEALERELRRADREGIPVSVLMIDIDRFKAFNDTFGHAAGDAALREVAAMLREVVRAEDLACRYGGEELAVIMAGIDPIRAADRAEEIRARVAAVVFGEDEGRSGHLTVSIGVATAPQHGTSPEQLVGTADEALYRAKAAGRDQVVVAPVP